MIGTLVLYCYNLSLEYSPKGPCVEGLVQSLWHYWEVVEPLGGGA
jgi:hypothetical protein